MARKSTKKRGRRGDRFPRTKRKADGEPGKRVPNSLIATLRGIRRLWCVGATDKPNTPQKFATLFAPSFKKVVDLYPAFRHEANNLPSFIESIEDNGKHTREISYYHLRAYAEHVNVPVGILMYFSHVLGDVMRGFTKEDIDDLIDSSIASLEGLRSFLNLHENIVEALAEVKPNDGELPRYNAKLEALAAMQDAFNKRRNIPAKQSPNMTG